MSNVREQLKCKDGGGKTITFNTGVPLNDTAIQKRAGEVKRRFGNGGTGKGGNIGIQGDDRDLLVSELEKRVFRVKRAVG